MITISWVPQTSPYPPTRAALEFKNVQGEWSKKAVLEFNFCPYHKLQRVIYWDWIMLLPCRILWVFFLRISVLRYLIWTVVWKNHKGTYFSGNIIKVIIHFMSVGVSKSRQTSSLNHFNFLLLYLMEHSASCNWLGS